MADSSDEEHGATRASRFSVLKSLRRGSIAGESYDPEVEITCEPEPVHPKTDDQRSRLCEALREVLLFRSLEMDQLHKVVDVMFERRVQKDERIIDQGEVGDNFYVIENGVYDVIKAEVNKESQIHRFEKSGSFGELALMYDTPRTASVIARSDGVLWAMTRTAFRAIVHQSAFKKRRNYQDLIGRLPLLSQLDQYERMTLSDALTSLNFSPGERIIDEGAPGDGMYFIEDGEVRGTVAPKSGSTSAEPTEIFKFGKGHYFGEAALIDNTNRSASVFAVGPVRVAYLERESFERLMGPCMDIMKTAMKDYQY